MNMSNTTKGIGVDLIEIERFKESYQRQGQMLIDRIFTIDEQKYCNKFKNPFPHFAGRFAAKEAIVKALGTGFSSLVKFLDIEILNDEKGKPFINLSKKVMDEFNNPNILISISHSDTHAIAFSTWI